ncbi:MAG: FKBP-type peptidyl-prolyl cis-trans isomerase [Chlamydiota bacterium]|nr:FKBP-type peptidyl-prolyl cis-trans isomerase [Chlamydiota bacterium]
MKTVAEGDKVKIFFKGTTHDGFTFSSGGSESEGFEVKLGEGQLLPSFETHLVGMAPGEEKKFVVTKEEGIPRRDDLVFEVEKEILPADQEFNIDDELVLSMPTGEKIEVIILKLTETHVTLDANPPVADKELSVEMKLIDIIN